MLLQLPCGDRAIPCPTYLNGDMEVNCLSFAYIITRHDLEPALLSMGVQAEPCTTSATEKSHVGVQNQSPTVMAQVPRPWDVFISHGDELQLLRQGVPGWLLN